MTKKGVTSNNGYIRLLDSKFIVLCAEYALQSTMKFLLKMPFLQTKHMTRKSSATYNKYNIAVTTMEITEVTMSIHRVQNVECLLRSCGSLKVSLYTDAHFAQRPRLGSL